MDKEKVLSRSASLNINMFITTSLQTVWVQGATNLYLQTCKLQPQTIIVTNYAESVTANPDRGAYIEFIYRSI